MYSRYTIPLSPLPKSTYRRLLRKNANSIGTLLLIFFGAELLFSVVLAFLTLALGIREDSSSGEFFLLENGAISMVVFFLVGIIYCVIGLSFSLMSNYVVSLVNSVFGLVGIENTGGNIDVGDQPNILLYVLVVAILPAFAEEFAFRGIVMGVLRPYSEGLAILVSSALFALMHGCPRSSFTF